MAQIATPEPEEKPLATVYASIVYYVTWDRGETIKIGTTTSPQRRFAALTLQAGRPADLVAAQPGSYREEKALHRKFRDLLVPGERELFYQRDKLVKHLLSVRKQWPNWRQIASSVDHQLTISG